MARSAHRACDDFRATSEGRRRELLGGGAALTRRRFLGWGAGAGISLYAGRALDAGRVLEVAAAEAAAAPDAPVLVSVFLPGGVDLLDTLVPLGTQVGRYADLRQDVRVRAPQSLVTGRLGIHPSLARGRGGGILGLFRRGQVGFLPGIDYANPDLSHFHSRHFWETGLITHDEAPGWLGRWLERHGSAENPLQGLSMSYGLSPVLRTSGAPVAAVSSPNDAQFWIPDVWGDPFDAAMAAYERLAERPARGAGAKAATHTAKLAKEVADRLRPYTEQDGRDPLAGPIAYPEGDLGRRLRTLAALIAQPLGVRVAAVDADHDFDTHDHQPEELGRGLAAVSEALSAFQADLERRGVARRVLTFVWSEFGRRPEANSSQGTDHGAGGLAWVMGPRARSGILSSFPSLTRFDREDNLEVTVDFRTVYASLLEQHLGTDAAEVIPNAGALGRVRLVR